MKCTQIAGTTATPPALCWAGSAVLLKVRLDGRAIWSAEGYGKLGHAFHDPYIELVKEKYPGAEAAP